MENFIFELFKDLNVMEHLFFAGNVVHPSRNLSFTLNQL
jgi:hypothetical protein